MRPLDPVMEPKGVLKSEVQNEEMAKNHLRKRVLDIRSIEKNEQYTSN